MASPLKVPLVNFETDGAKMVPQTDQLQQTGCFFYVFFPPPEKVEGDILLK